MNKGIYITFFYLFLGAATLHAQNLAVYSMNLMESNDSSGFISLSERYYLSGHPDSLAMPDLSEEGSDASQQYDHIKLTSRYRKQFLYKTGISDTDKVFIYSYSKNILISFPVSNLNVVAYLNIYASEGPYGQEDYMIGFEINKKYLKGFEQYFTTTLVCIGKTSPFILNQMKPIAWKKIDAEKFPVLASDTTKNAALKRFHYGSDYIKGNTYMYETNDLQYFVQNILMNKEDSTLIARHVFVWNKNTYKILRSVVYVDHESESPSPLNFVESEYVEQWTGKLFKNRAPVMLGFQYVSFGCPSIEFLSPDERDIYIYCDNRH